MPMVDISNVQEVVELAGTTAARAHERDVLGRLTAVYENGASFVYEHYRVIADQVGSVRRIINAETGVTVFAADYSPFGVVVAESGAFDQPFGFAGGMRDELTGLTRFGARDYDPQVGRWTSKDPIRFDGGLNLYEYAAGAPQMYVDPTGLSADFPTWLLDNPIADALVGVGDGVSFGLTARLRDWMGTCEEYGDSAGYAAGRGGGQVVGGVLVFAGLGYAYNAMTMPATLTHFSTAEGAAQIASSGKIYASIRGLFGPGVYLTSGSSSGALVPGASSVATTVSTAGRNIVPTAWPGVFRHIGDLIL